SSARGDCSSNTRSGWGCPPSFSPLPSGVGVLAGTSPVGHDKRCQPTTGSGPLSFPGPACRPFVLPEGCLGVVETNVSNCYVPKHLRRENSFPSFVSASGGPARRKPRQPPLPRGRAERRK